MPPSADSPPQSGHRLGQAFVLLAAAFFFSYALLTPEHNWDMLGYAASALKLTGQDEATVHATVYRELEAYVPAGEFHSLSAGTDYRRVMFDDPGVFAQQIPYYQIRIVFVTLMLLLSGLGLSLYSAGHVLASASAALGLVVFFYAYRPFLRPAFWVILPFVYFVSGVQNAAQSVTADSIAFLWLALICFAFIRSHWSVFPLLALAVLIRTDLVVWVALALGYLFLFSPERRPAVVLTALATGSIYVAINWLVGNHGWATVFYFVFISDMQATHPDQFSKFGVSLPQYLSVTIGNLRSILYDSRFWLFSVNVLLQLIIFLRLNESHTLSREALAKLTKNPLIVLTLMSVAYLVLHYLLFPAIWSRFFIAQYFVAYLGLLAVLSDVNYRV